MPSRDENSYSAFTVIQSRVNPFNLSTFCPTNKVMITPWHVTSPTESKPWFLLCMTKCSSLSLFFQEICQHLIWISNFRPNQGIPKPVDRSFAGPSALLQNKLPYCRHTRWHVLRRSPQADINIKTVGVSVLAVCSTLFPSCPPTRNVPCRFFCVLFWGEMVIVNFYSLHLDVVFPPTVPPISPQAQQVLFAIVCVLFLCVFRSTKSPRKLHELSLKGLRHSLSVYRLLGLWIWMC